LVAVLLAYISDKDLSAEFYRKLLARRLLQVPFSPFCPYSMQILLSKVLCLLAYISDKDVCGNLKRLARRLLQVRFSVVSLVMFKGIVNTV
jgi:hypothetical protein